MPVGKDADAGDRHCHCGSGRDFDQCCGRFINGDCTAPTAEELMRSRYSAFVVGNEPYLLSTWHPDTRPSRVRFDPRQRWLGLSIKSTQDGKLGDAAGRVEFVARFKIDGKGHRLHEISRFRHIDSNWYYLDGEHL